MVKVGSMKTKLHLLLVAGVIAVGLRCASSTAPKQARSEGTSPAEVTAGENSQATLTGLEFEAAPTPRLVLHTTGKPAYTSYSPHPDVFVIDLPKTTKNDQLSIASTFPAPIVSVAADEAVELGSPLTRVTVRFSRATSPAASATGDSVVVTLDPSAAVQLTEAQVEAVAVVEESPAAAATMTLTSASTAPAVEIYDGPKAKKLTGVLTAGAGSTLEVTLAGDGAIDYNAFRLANPLRIVLDLKGVKSTVTKNSYPLGDPFIKRIRVSQFKTTPESVTRVVFDLDEFVDFRVTRSGKNLRIRFGDGVQASSTLPVAVASTVSENPFAAPPERISPVETLVVNSSADQVPPATSTQPTPRAVPPAPVTPPRAVSPTQSTVRGQLPTSTVTGTPVEEVFVENAERPAASNLSGGAMSAGSGSRTLSPGDRVYTGDPIDLTLKDADIKDVLRTFAQITGLNIAIDPQVNGSVTVQFEDVPWDQALDLILQQNGLTWVLQGNVMRIGTLDRIAAEQVQTRKLDEESRLNVPLTTVSQKLSYAKAGDVAGLLQNMASPRGKIIVDTRTNQLIITEIADPYLRTMLNLIETVDIPTPQVVIEARIVETTKNFSQQLGVSFGFSGALDPSLGTGTGLQFPNRVGFTGGPFNFESGNPIITLSLGDVLGTFDLDLVLTAAETEGLARIVSAPRITTQDNTSASIQSGIQIPVQTRVNFTTTISYIDATLQLQVTPQITAQDTIIMDINVQKVEPLFGLAVEGSQNIPLSTRRAQTRLMVRDGGTTVIGGIYQASENRGQSRVPYLHQIPVLGNLFKNKTFNSRHDELLIFITPRIVRGS